MKVKAIKQDCLQGLKGMEPKSIDCVITSPPYNVGIKYSQHDDNRPQDEFDAWLHSIWLEVFDKLKDDGHFFLQVGGTATKPLVPWQILQGALKVGFVLQNQIIWVKSIAIDGVTYGQFKPLNSDRFDNHTHEFIFHLTKTGKVEIDKLAIGVPFKFKSNIDRFKSNKSDVRARGNCWHIPYETIQSKLERFGHPATFPVALPRMCIEWSGIPEGSLVVDPFSGIGSTLLACVETKMEGIGFDIDAAYVDGANELLSAGDHPDQHARDGFTEALDRLDHEPQPSVDADVPLERDKPASTSSKHPAAVEG